MSSYRYRFFWIILIKLNSSLERNHRFFLRSSRWRICLLFYLWKKITRDSAAIHCTDWASDYASKMGFGFAQSRGLYTKENQALEVAAEFRKKKNRLMLFISRMASVGLKTFKILNGEKAIIPIQAMLKKLKDNGFKMIVSQDPVVSQKDNKQWAEADKLGVFCERCPYQQGLRYALVRAGMWSSRFYHSRSCRLVGEISTKTY